MPTIKLINEVKLIGFMFLTFLCTANGYALRAKSLPFEDCGKFLQSQINLKFKWKI